MSFSLAIPSCKVDIIIPTIEALNVKVGKEHCQVPGIF